MSRQRVLTGTPLPKALACGMLEDNGRILFLLKKGTDGIERIAMPGTLVVSGRSPVAEIRNEFNRQTGIDGEIHEIVFETRYNAGSKRRKVWVPCLVFKVTAKNRSAKPASEYSGYRWLSIEDAKTQKLARNSEWVARGLTKENKQ